jgi:AcrR family transcriptional regulator
VGDDDGIRLVERFLLSGEAEVWGDTEKGERQMAQGFTRLGTSANGGAVAGASALTPSVPPNIGVQAQQQRILEAMAKSVAEKSVSATTIADIVGCASISRATFYKHFVNKRECFYATADSFLVELRGTAEIAHAESEEGEGSRIDSVRDAIAAVIECLVAKPAHTKLLLVEAPIVDPEIVRDYRSLAITALERQLTNGDVASRPKADPEIAFGRAMVLIADYVAARQVEALPSLLPELVYIALLPYAGQEMALAQARLSR